jgi:hypothetical protein
MPGLGFTFQASEVRIQEPGSPCFHVGLGVNALRFEEREEQMLRKEEVWMCLCSSECRVDTYAEMGSSKLSAMVLNMALTSSGFEVSA